MKVPVVLRTPEVSVNIFTALLRYLYTGDFGLDESRQHCLKKLLAQIVAEFGAPNSLEQDLRTLLDTGAYSDAVLVFSDSSEPGNNEYGGGYASPRQGGQCVHSQCPHTTGGGTLRGTGSVVKPEGSLSMIRRYRNELRCHKAILAARSSFFRNLELRRGRSGEDLTERHLHAPSYIVLDESIIPKRYARVLLGAVYLDCVDLTSIMRSSASVPTLADTSTGGGGSSSGQTSGQVGAHMTHVDEAMELYHIGRFLEISALAHG